MLYQKKKKRSIIINDVALFNGEVKLTSVLAYKLLPAFISDP